MGILSLAPDVNRFRPVVSPGEHREKRGLSEINGRVRELNRTIEEYLALKGKKRLKKELELLEKQFELLEGVEKWTKVLIVKVQDNIKALEGEAKARGAELDVQTAHLNRESQAFQKDMRRDLSRMKTEELPHARKHYEDRGKELKAKLDEAGEAKKNIAEFKKEVASAREKVRSGCRRGLHSMKGITLNS